MINKGLNWVLLTVSSSDEEESVSREEYVLSTAFLLKVPKTEIYMRSCGISRHFRFKFAQMLLTCAKFNLPQNPAIIAYTMLWAGYFISSEFANFTSWDSFTIFPLRARYSLEDKVSTFLISPFLSNSILP